MLIGQTYLIILWRELVQALLNDVVAVQVLDENDDVQTERHDDRVDLAAGRQEINHLLHSTRAMHVQGDVHEILSNRLADKVPLFIRGVLQQLLTEVVAKWI